MCRSTWKPSFGAAAHCRAFAPSARGGMTPALAHAGFQVQVLHVFTAMALPKRVVSGREDFSPSPSGFPHGSSTSTGGNASV